MSDSQSVGEPAWQCALQNVGDGRVLDERGHLARRDDHGRSITTNCEQSDAQKESEELMPPSGMVQQSHPQGCGKIHARQREFKVIRRTEEGVTDGGTVDRDRLMPALTVSHDCRSRSPLQGSGGRGKEEGVGVRLQNRTRHERYGLRVRRTLGPHRQRMTALIM